MSNIPENCKRCKIVQSHSDLEGCTQHAVYLDVDDYFMALEIQQKRFCKCGKVIEHGNSKNPWCSLWCPEYRAYLKSKPKSRLDLVMEKKHRAIDNTLFAQAMGVVL